MADPYFRESYLELAMRASNELPARQECLESRFKKHAPRAIKETHAFAEQAMHQGYPCPRPLLRSKRETTPKQLVAHTTNDEQPATKYAPLENISDSEQANMEVFSSDNDESSQPHKKREMESDSKPASLPPGVLLALSRRSASSLNRPWHQGTKDVRVDPQLNKKAWEAGIKGVPIRLRVRIARKQA
ncbi:hypothetical protein N8T08_001639 [Aspergillus melleus]|uniref:Uncharacterized protein n=1 Tax=Aspergillus melleus TaxID=138277 RepID=A0ACC3AMZ3_9EURO|nr:hypothetical protein N8T08_001639 [Aspergillus melleus]